MLGQKVPSSSLNNTEMLTSQVYMEGTWQGWRNSLTRTSWNQTKANVVLHLVWTTSCSSTIWALLGRKLCRSGHGSPGEEWVDHDPVMCHCSEEGKVHPGCMNMSVDSRLKEVVLPLYASGVPQRRNILMYWSEFSRGLPRQTWRWSRKSNSRG